MKLYFAPGACSFSPHIVLREAGLDFELELVDLRTKVTSTGADYRAINPLGYVPALQLDDGTVLTEGPAIIQYVADLVPDKALAPAAGSMARYRLAETLNFLSTEVHKTWSPLFRDVGDDQRTMIVDRLRGRIAHLGKRLEHQSFLEGDHFTVADAYFYTLLSWARWTKVDLSDMPAITAYQAKIAERPAVVAALAAEKALRPRNH